MTITFYGGAGGVTGSKHLLEVGDKKILFDCGTFQGLPDVRERNREFPFPPDEIDAVILSHAHIDHCGMLPLLVKRGFAGPVYSTPATRDVAELMLDDAAGIEEQDAEYRQRHHVGAYEDRVPLFTRKDIPAVMDRFETVDYVRHGGSFQEVVPDVHVKFYDAGHILGSAISVVKAGGICIAYSGDVGAPGTPLLFDPQVPGEEISTLLLESTYGDRRHEPLSTAVDRLADTINKVCDRQGKMIVPAFSLGRTQVLVYVIHKLVDEGRIPRFPIFVDSPLATNLTDVYRNHEHDYDTETWADFVGDDHKPLSFRNLTYTRSVQESKALNSQKGPFMVISASGMMTAGRVVHHLRHSISDSRNSIFITGYQAEGTLGRRLLEGASKASLYGDSFPVKAEIELFNEFSAHADRTDLEKLASGIKGVKKVVLVHGEPIQADEFKDELTKNHPDWEVERPGEGDVVEII